MARALLTICIFTVCLVAMLTNPGIGVLLIGMLVAWSALRGARGRVTRQRRKVRARSRKGPAITLFLITAFYTPVMLSRSTRWYRVADRFRLTRVANGRL